MSEILCVGGECDGMRFPYSGKSSRFYCHNKGMIAGPVKKDQDSYDVSDAPDPSYDYYTIREFSFHDGGSAVVYGQRFMSDISVFLEMVNKYPKE